MTRDLSEFPKIDRADVYKSGQLAAELRRLSDRVEFVYRAEYVNERGRAIATSLPPTNEAVWAPAGSVPPFFAGLLPEGRRLFALQRRIKTSADDEFSLLLSVGNDSVGDVQVVPYGDRNVVEPSIQVEESWESVDFQELFQVSTGWEPDTTGIPGVQDKISDRMISLPVGQRRGRYILKLSPPGFPNVVENEAFFLEAARKVGLVTPDFEIVKDRVGRSGLLVYRFDRRTRSNGDIEMIAQEDGLQVLGRYPADKYSVSVESVLRGLASVTGAPVVAAFRLFPMIVFAYLTGNGDLHAKNLSVYAPEGDVWEVAPAYDLPSSYFYNDYYMALPMAGEERPTDVTREEMINVGRNVGIGVRAAGRVLDEQLEASAAWFDRIDALPFNERQRQKFRRFVENRIKLLKSE